MRFLEKLCVRYVPLAQTPFDDRVLTNVNTRALYERRSMQNNLLLSHGPVLGPRTS